MAREDRRSNKKHGDRAKLGLEEKLWQSVVKPPRQVVATENKPLTLGSLFLKYTTADALYERHPALSCAQQRE